MSWTCPAHVFSSAPTFASATPTASACAAAAAAAASSALRRCSASSFSAAARAAFAGRLPREGSEKVQRRLREGFGMPSGPRVCQRLCGDRVAASARVTRQFSGLRRSSRGSWQFCIDAEGLRLLGSLVREDVHRKERRLVRLGQAPCAPSVPRGVPARHAHGVNAPQAWRAHSPLSGPR